MRSVPLHWLLIVCFLATPVSQRGQAADALPMSPHEFATALLNLSARPLEAPRAAQPAQPARQAASLPDPRDLRPVAAHPASTAPTPRSLERPTAQPAGP
jgi:hypothetical protein